VLGKGWGSDLRIHHMFFRFPPPYYLQLTTYDWRTTLCPMVHALCFFVASRPKADPPTSRPGGPVLKPARGEAVSTGGAYAPEQLKGEGD